MKAVLRSVVDKKGEEKQYIEVRSGTWHLRLWMIQFIYRFVVQCIANINGCCIADLGRKKKAC